MAIAQVDEHLQTLPTVAHVEHVIAWLLATVKVRSYSQFNTVLPHLGLLSCRHASVRTTFGRSEPAG
jgi:hypothetical protein